MPLWGNLLWSGLFVLLTHPGRLGPRGAVGLAALGLIPRFLTLLGTVGTVWMLSGLAWFSVMAFYAMTVLWLVVLVLLLRNRADAAMLAGWMTPVAVLEGLGALSAMAGIVVGLLLGGVSQSILRPLVAGVFAIAQVFFLLRTARTS